MPLFHEKFESFLSKMILSPKTCYGVLNEGRLIAYAISFPWVKDESVDLNSASKNSSAKTDTMYIHDISVDPDYRGLGLGEALYKRILEDTLSSGLKELALVAGQGSSKFWARFGFVNSDSEVEGYGAEAVKMVLKL